MTFVGATIFPVNDGLQAILDPVVTSNRCIPVSSLDFPGLDCTCIFLQQQSSAVRLAP